MGCNYCQDDDDDAPPSARPRQPPTATEKGKKRDPETGIAPKEKKLTPPPSRPSSPPNLQAPPVQPQPGPSRPVRERKVPVRPGNVYGESRHPVDIEKDIRRKKDWSKVVGERPQSTRVRKPVTKFGAKAPEPKPPVLEEQSEDDDSSQSDKSEEYVP